uniref:hypothetical protein n=1 Tax=Streptomyces sp. SS7 TaxID=3108485 RepID=UPI00403FED0F
MIQVGRIPVTPVRTILGHVDDARLLTTIAPACRSPVVSVAALRRLVTTGTPNCSGPTRS